MAVYNPKDNYKYDKLFFAVPDNNIRGNIHELHFVTFRLDIRKYFLHRRVWHRSEVHCPVRTPILYL